MACAVSLGGCSPESAAITQPAPNASQDMAVRVVVTRDFGQQVLLDTIIEVPAGCSAMSALEGVADVTTKYGGGFINSIDGLSSQYTGGQGGQCDWLVYMNGIQSKKGAADYALRNGDTQQWDFHDWSFRQFTPATIGCYPQPFLSGYEGNLKPTVIVYEEDYAEKADELRGSLAYMGVADVSTRTMAQLSESDRQGANLIIIGTLGSNALLSEMNGAWSRLGFFAEYSDGSITTYAGDGSVSSVYGEGTGLLQTTQSPWNPKGTGVCENVAWMVCGTDAAGVAAAVDVLIHRRDAIEHAFAAVVVGDSVIRIPQ